MDKNYSKIFCEVLNKEESNNTNKKNLNISFNKSNLTNIKNNANNSKNIIKIELFYNKKNNSNINIKGYSNTSKKENKLYFNNSNNLNNVNIKKNQKIFQSNSEKNITKELIFKANTKKNIYLRNKNIINTNINCTSSNKKRESNINFRPNTGHFVFKKRISSNNKNERNKSSEKKSGETMKNIEDIREITINLQNKINEIFENKKGYEQDKNFYQSNSNLNEIKNNKSNSIHKNKIINRNMLKNKILSGSENVNNPDKIIITINNVNTGNKNKNIQSKIYKYNTNMNNSNDIDYKKINISKNKKKYTKKNNTYCSTNSQIRKSSNINLKKKYIANKKNNINSSRKNYSNSKINNSNNHISNKKGIKIESINIDLNLTNNNNKNDNSQKKDNKNNSLIYNNNVIFRETELPKYPSKFNHIQGYLELSLNCPNKSTESNQSFISSYSLIKKTKSLSRKRDEKKRMNLFKFSHIIDEKENEKILNDILFNLSSQKKNENKYKNNCQKSEPKKLIDKIRKALKIKKS